MKTIICNWSNLLNMNYCKKAIYETPEQVTIKFLFLPMTINGKRRWLEHVIIGQKCFYDTYEVDFDRSRTVPIFKNGKGKGQMFNIAFLDILKEDFLEKLENDR